jgi:hypothetical protein
VDREDRELRRTEDPFHRISDLKVRGIGVAVGPTEGTIQCAVIEAATIPNSNTITNNNNLTTNIRLGKNEIGSEIEC